MDPYASIKRRGRLYCWNCGRTEGARPKDWCAPFRLEIAHIASGQGRARRVEDARAVTLLCSRCHKCHVSDSDQHPTQNFYGIDYPTIDERHTLWLKEKMEGWIDWDFLCTIWIGLPPATQRPPEYWCREFTKHLGILR
jgi:hypothetical protein